MSTITLGSFQREDRLVVRRTFWEIESSDDEGANLCTRTRAYTDTFLLDPASDDHFAPHSEAVKKEENNSGASTPTGSWNDSFRGSSSAWSDEESAQEEQSPSPSGAWWPSQSYPMVQVMVPFMMPMPAECSLEERAKALHMASERLKVEARSARVAAASHRIETLNIPTADRTTLMLRNLPSQMTRKMLLDLLDSLGFVGLCDFIYVPLDFKKGRNLGYAFVNFISHEDAEMAMSRFQGFSAWSMPSDLACAVVWAAPHQGLEAHIERYRNSPVMHPDVSDEYKPLILSNGISIPFPAPTTELSPPTIMPKTQQGRGNRSNKRTFRRS